MSKENFDSVRRLSLRFKNRRQKVIAILLSVSMVFVCTPFEVMATYEKPMEFAVLQTSGCISKEEFEDKMIGNIIHTEPPTTTEPLETIPITSTTQTTIVTTTVTTTTTTVLTTTTTTVEEVEKSYEEYEEDDEYGYEYDYSQTYSEEDPDDYYDSEGHPKIKYSIEGLSEEDYIRICNTVQGEAGSDWLTAKDKGNVIEVIMNRLNSNDFPDTIEGVLYDGFSETYSGNGSYLNSKVSGFIQDSVYNYFENPDQFTEGYIEFTGDGYQNHFH